MANTYVRLEVPEEVKDKRFKQEYLSTAQRILKEQTVLRLFQNRKVSSGKAARMLGMPLYDFMRFLSLNRVSVFNFTKQELIEEFRAAEKLAGKDKKTARRKKRP